MWPSARRVPVESESTNMKSTHAATHRAAFAHANTAQERGGGAFPRTMVPSARM